MCYWAVSGTVLSGAYLPREIRFPATFHVVWQHVYRSPSADSVSTVQGLEALVNTYFEFSTTI